MHRVYHYLLSSPYQMVCTHRQTCPHTIERQCILHTKGFSLSFLKLPQNAPWAHLFIGWIGLFPLGTMWPSVCSHNSQDSARMVLWMENWAWAAAKQLPSRTDRLIKRAAKPEKNRRCCASFTVRENTAVLNSRDPLSKLAILRGKKQRIPLFQAVMTPAEVKLSRLSCFPCSHCHCCGWMWREKGQRTEPSTPTERMVHYVRKSLQTILLYYKTGRKEMCK